MLSPKLRADMGASYDCGRLLGERLVAATPADRLPEELRVAARVTLMGRGTPTSIELAFGRFDALADERIAREGFLSKESEA